MNQPAASAENVFARAAELPPGPARDELLAAECANDAALRNEVESLLRAHEAAGDFLRERALIRPALPLPVSPSQHTTAIDAAAQAETFLRDADRGINPPLEAFLAALPEAVRGEAGERIAAGLRVRQGRIQPPAEAAGGERPIPVVTGYRLGRKIGEGSLGAVYAAHDEKLNRPVAIKILHQRADEATRRRVLDEARKTAALRDPAIVTIFSVLDEADPPAIVMELVEGFALDRFTAELNFEQKARLLREVARGLAVAHEHGVIHRDLKPDNVIVGPDMRPRILDFGLALSLEEAGRQGFGFEGTPLYASPEQVQGHSLTPASDVFSLGSLMFKVLTGRPPFLGQTTSQTLEAIATTAPPFLRAVAVGVPEDLQAVCLACLAWKAVDRPTAAEVATELGRFLVGEPVRVRPKLYGDLLRRSISEYSGQARAWASQSIISREERDALEVVHRRLLADEDHWIIDARRITPLQTILSGATWLAVVATVLMVWMLRNDLAPLWRWLLPTYFTAMLLIAGQAARREHEPLAAATFLAGAALAIAPCTLALLAELHVFAAPSEHVKQLFAGTFTNQQVFTAACTALAVSVFGLWRLKMTGFAWTSAILGSLSYISWLLLFNWLDRKPEIQALWCLPLVALEPVALVLERRGRVRWTLPFHLVALLTLVIGLDVIALNGPTLEMLGVNASRWPYFDEERLKACSIVLNGVLFLALMLLTERAPSLDLRRSGKLLEVLAIVHTLTALFANAMNHQNDPHVRADVWLYLAAAGVFMVLAPFRSRWRLLVGGLAGCGLGSYLLVELGIVDRQSFIIGLGFAGLLVALGTFSYVRRREQVAKVRSSKSETNPKTEIRD
ncbi:MAG TPA: serine/threonine-protein kinase [Candidatus Acidoferrales bacterium]|nr:serine/threonine-protein kinase [Candidatus Acidoferrales bacterium]